MTDADDGWGIESVDHDPTITKQYDELQKAI